jgi:cytochrome c556
VLPNVDRDAVLKEHAGPNFVAKESMTAMETKEHEPFDVEATRTSSRTTENVAQEEDMDTSNDFVQDLSYPTEPTVSYSFDEMSCF